MTSWGSGPLAGCGVYKLDSGILPLPLQGLGGAEPGWAGKFTGSQASPD